MKYTDFIPKIVSGEAFKDEEIRFNIKLDENVNFSENILVFSKCIFHEDVIFENTGDIILRGGNIEGLSKGVKFNNGGSVGTAELNLFVGGISNKRVLNCMIKQLYGE